MEPNQTLYEKKQLKEIPKCQAKKCPYVASGMMQIKPDTTEIPYVKGEIRIDFPLCDAHAAIFGLGGFATHFESFVSKFKHNEYPISML